jgi:hypothetical protein
MFAQIHEIEPLMMFYVNPFNSLDVSVVAKAVIAVCEANVEVVQLEMLELQNSLTL